MLEGCTPAAQDGWSVARAWDEVLLDAIRRDFPAPDVHARNLFHLSRRACTTRGRPTTPIADGYFVDEKHTATDVAGGARAGDQLRGLPDPVAPLRDVGGRARTTWPSSTALAGLGATTRRSRARPAADPASLGNRIADTIITFGLTDGSLEQQGYKSADYLPGQRAAHRQEAGHRDGGPEPLAAARAGLPGDAERPAAAGQGPDVRRAVLGTRRVVRADALRRGTAARSRRAAAAGRRRPTNAAFKASAVDIIRSSASLDATRRRDARHLARRPGQQRPGHQRR